MDSEKRIELEKEVEELRNMQNQLAVDKDEADNQITALKNELAIEKDRRESVKWKLEEVKKENTKLFGDLHNQRDSSLPVNHPDCVTKMQTLYDELEREQEWREMLESELEKAKLDNTRLSDERDEIDNLHAYDIFKAKDRVAELLAQLESANTAAANMESMAKMDQI